MKYKLLAAIIAVIFLIGCGLSAYALLAPPQKTIEVLSDGEVIYTADLSVAPDTRFTVSYADHTNTVEIVSGAIRVSEADCPNQICVGMGWLSSAGLPIVCAPNRLVIRYAGASDVDAVAG